MTRWRALAAPVAFVVVLLLVVTTWTPLLDLDHDLADGLNDATAPHPSLVSFWKLSSTVGQPLTFQVLATVTALVLWRTSGQARLPLFVAVSALLSGTVTNLVKLLVGRDRPTVPDPIAHATASSFPSGHAMSSLVGVTVLLVVIVPPLRQRWRTPVVAMGVLVVLLVGFSRLALGVHYLSDVVGGWLLAISWLSLVRTLTAREWRAPRPASRGRPPAPPAG